MTRRITYRIAPVLSTALALLCYATPTAFAHEGDAQVSESEESASSGFSHQLVIAPTLAAYIGASFLNREVEEESRQNTHFTMSLGLSGNVVQNDIVAGFLSGNLEVELTEVDDKQVTYFMPMVQFGASFSSWDDPSVGTAMFPALRMYGLVGVRPAPPWRDLPMARLGVGLSSMWIPLAALSGGAILPSHIEYIAETDLHGSTMHMFRVGIGL